VIVALWCVALLLFAPLLVVRQTSRVVVAGMDHQLVFCIEKWPTPADRLTYSIVCFVVVYAVPGSIVILAYSLMGRRLCAASLLQQMDAAAAAATPGVARHQAGGERLVRDRKRVARILLLLAILFALCWLPYNILNLMLDFDEHHPHSEQILELLPFTLLLGHANSAINPLLYCFLTKNFRLVLFQRYSDQNK
jgi:7 transmembrane receptor (rhodopsin family)